ncbi:MAG: hypothetical protein WCO57_01740 [Verrucomicrobiota bacterium]
MEEKIKDSVPDFLSSIQNSKFKIQNFFPYPLTETPCRAAATEHTMPFTPSQTRAVPKWRDKQRLLPMSEKVELIGRFIQETRQLELVKKSCKLFAMSWSNSSMKDP